MIGLILFLALQIGIFSPTTFVPQPTSSTGAFTAGGACVSYNAGAATSSSCTLSPTPSVGDLVIVTLVAPGGPANSLAFSDGSSHVYSITPSSPATLTAYSVYTYLGYYVIAGSPSSAINASWSNSLSYTVFSAAAYHLSSGTITFDQDAKTAAGGVTATGTLADLPSITPAVAGELMFCAGTADNGISAPTAGSTQGGMTGLGIEPNTLEAGEYSLSVSATQTANFTLVTSGDNYMALCGAWKP